jgi:hypothetical protein
MLREFYYLFTTSILCGEHYVVSLYTILFALYSLCEGSYIYISVCCYVGFSYRSIIMLCEYSILLRRTYMCYFSGSTCVGIVWVRIFYFEQCDMCSSQIIDTYILMIKPFVSFLYGQNVSVSSSMWSRGYI